MLAGPKATVQLARKLRRQMTWPEVILWRRFRQRPYGLKFRRQHPAGPYVLDFFCSGANVAIEVDGQVHNMGKRPTEDAHRSAWLEARGIDLIRVSASDVTRSPDEIAEGIAMACLARLNPLHRSPSGPLPRSGEETKE